MAYSFTKLSEVEKATPSSNSNILIETGGIIQRASLSDIKPAIKQFYYDDPDIVDENNNRISYEQLREFWDQGITVHITDINDEYNSGSLIGFHYYEDYCDASNSYYAALFSRGDYVERYRA